MRNKKLLFIIFAAISILAGGISNAATPYPPVTISPGETSGPGPVISDLTPTFSWNAGTNAVYYGLYISEWPYGTENLVFDSEVDFGLIYGTIFTLPESNKLEPGKLYRWNMASYNSEGWSYDLGTGFSERRYFQTEAIPDPPVLNSPSNGSHQNCGITFQWNSVSGATKYELFVLLPGAASWVSDETTSTSYNHSPGAIGQYHWKVKAYANGNWSDYSSEWTFYFDGVFAPTLISPPNGSETTDVRPTFQWNSVSCANYYELQLARNSSFTDMVIVKLSIYGTSWQLDNQDLFIGQTYYWRVRSSSPIGLWSNVWHFTISTLQYTLNASVVSGHGSVSPTSGSYAASTVVTLTATPNTGYRVKAWSGTNNDSSTSNTNAVTMNSNKTVTVEFEPEPPFDFSLSVTPTSGTMPKYGSITANVTATLTSGIAEPITLSSYSDTLDAVIILLDPDSGTPPFNSEMLITTLFNAPPAGPSLGEHLIVFTGSGGGTSKTATFSLTITPPTITEPTVSTSEVSDKTTSSATLNGNLDSTGGETCQVWFEWGTTTSYGTSTAKQSKSSTGPFSQQISNLQSGTTYHFRAYASNSKGTAYGSDKTFTTSEPTVTEPTVTTHPATSVGETTATLRGRIDDDGGEACQYRFSYWGAGSYTSNSWSSATKVTDESFYLDISDLEPGTLYHFKAYAKNSAGESESEPESFTTKEMPKPAPPTLLSPGSELEPGEEVDTLTPTLQWEEVMDADYYALAISEEPYGHDHIVYKPQELYGTSHQVPDGELELGKKYRWNMQAYNSAGWSDVSDTLFFQTPSPIEITVTMEGLFGVKMLIKNNDPDEECNISFALLDKDGGNLQVKYLASVVPDFRQTSENSLMIPHNNWCELNIIFDPQQAADSTVLSEVHVRLSYSVGAKEGEIEEELSFEGFTDVVATGFDLNEDTYNFINNIDGYHCASYDGGYCYGMAETSILYFEGLLSLPPNKSTHDLSVDEALEEIAIYQWRWANKETFIISDLKCDSDDYNDLCQSISHNHPMLIMLGLNRYLGAHAVVAYKIVKDNNRKRSYIFVYDSNLLDAYGVIIYDWGSSTQPKRPAKFLPYGEYAYMDVQEADVLGTAGRKASWAWGWVSECPVETEPGTIWAIFMCPVNIEITDQYGRVITNTGINEIPGAYCEITDKYTIFYLPTDLSYSTKVEAYDKGTFGYATVCPIEAGITEVMTFEEDVTVDANTVIQIEGTSMEIDYDGDGIFERNITGSTDIIYKTETTVDFDISLAGCWTMDDNAVDAMVVDSSGNGNHGTAQRATHDLHTTGVIDGALAFNGSSDYINCGNRNRLDIAGSITVSAWVNPYSPDGTIISKRTYRDEPVVQYLLDFDNNNLRFVWYNVGWKGVYQDAVAASNQWLHVAGTYDADSNVVALYVNGIQVASGAEESGLVSNDLSVMIGAWHNGVTAVDVFEGAIDQVMIFDRALSQEELEALYWEGVITPVPPSALSEALDTALSFTTGGSADWFSQTTMSHYDGDAAQSGDISDSQESWMQTTVSGTGTVKFYWKVSSEEDFDFLEFYIDGSLQEKISGSVNWQQKTYTISTSGSHTLEWRYMKDGSVSSGSDCGWVDKVTTP